MMRAVLQDLRYAFRLVFKAPGFAAVAVITLALGIGANTAIFSIVNSALLRPLSYRDPQQLYLVREIVPQMAKFYPVLNANLPDFRIWQKQMHSFADVAVAESITADLSGMGEAQVIRGIRASANIFDLLSAPPALGRGFRGEEDESGQGNVIVLTETFWRNRFGGDPAVIGKTVTLDGVSREIIGILPASFRFPAALGGMNDSSRVAFLEPINGMKDYERDLIGEFDFAAVSRLRPGVTSDQAIAELNVVQAQIAKEANEGVDLMGTLQPLQDRVVGPARRGMLFLLAAVGAVLLIVCANLANLMLTRVPARIREASIRTALGATPMHIVRQLLTETLLLSVAGGALGIWAAGVAVKWIAHDAAASIPRLEEVHIDGRVALFALCVSIVTGALIGLLPAWRVARSHSFGILKSTGLTTTENRRTRLRETLVGFEVGLTTVLLVVAGLLMASLGRLLTIHAGFTADQVLVAHVDLPSQVYSDSDARLRFNERLLADLRSLPGFRSTGWISISPLDGEGSVTGIATPEMAKARAETPMANYRGVSAEYFSAMGIPLLKGRIFSPADRGRKIVVVSQNVADRFWPGMNPIGQICVTQWGPEEPAEVIGVVGDVRTVQLDEAPTMMVYVPEWFNTISVPFSPAFVLRVDGDPASYVGPIRELIHKIGPDVPITSLQPMQQTVSQSVDARRFPMVLAISFAVCSLVLACLGIFGVIGYSVEQRRQELGIRMALGARVTELRDMVLRQGMVPVLIGVVAGLGAALASGRLMSSLLFGISPYDPFTFGAVTVVVTAVALLACYLPARRATKIDPNVALRYE